MYVRDFILWTPVQRHMSDFKVCCKFLDRETSNFYVSLAGELGLEGLKRLAPHVNNVS